MGRLGWERVPALELCGSRVGARLAAWGLFDAGGFRFEDFRLDRGAALANRQERVKGVLQKILANLRGGGPPDNKSRRQQVTKAKGLDIAPTAGNNTLDATHKHSNVYHI